MKLTTALQGLLASLALSSAAFAGTSAPAAKNCTACPVPPPAEDLLGIEVGLGYDSSLIFRGVEYGEHWLSTSLSLDVPLCPKTALKLDANYGLLADDNDAFLGGLSYQRLELGAAVTYDLGAAELGVGYRWYHHMGDLDAILHDGHEVGLTATTSAGPVNIGAAAYYDFESEGWYFEVAVNSEIKLTERISLVPGASIGYGVDYDWHVNGGAALVDDGFTAVNVSLALPIQLCKSATLTPFIACNIPVDALDDAGEDTKLHGGVMLTVRF